MAEIEYKYKLVKDTIIEGCLECCFLNLSDDDGCFQPEVMNCLGEGFGKHWEEVKNG